ncbi:hypothetical protein RE428_25120 [Marinobacter nanhaiticus D15-8W]|uniref:Uncharacterized protein n=1 Tax=Marinobacter nanhaiticus D15-8W TaxID=626887 RepID=N6WSW4_9GAMM|nr:hypothetical protein [Marinobacter nanhaiticus]ENO14112.1 hypothetical protein J057_22000 [Marinobacter nanhaiticus D15-8W]BES71494.1 hypothetical protein RE428_25120 [Marinobacter nanhaiticus D15-8W]
MKIDTLYALQRMQEMFDNGSARVTEVKGNGSQQIAQEVASTIYHRNEPVLPPGDGTYNVQGLINKNIESPAAMTARYNRVQELFGFEIGNRAVDLELSYVSGVESLSTAVKNKDWGLSIQDGELKVIEGSDSLTEHQRTSISNVLKTAGVEYAAQFVADAVIEMIELERGQNGLSRSIGRFDVNQSNFADVVDLRRFIEDYRPGGKYGKGLVDPSDIQGRYFLAGAGIMDQVAVRAEETFLYTER